MRTLLNATFTKANMPSVTLPPGTVPTPPAFPISSLAANCLAWFEARYGVSYGGTVASWADQFTGNTEKLIPQAARSAPSFNLVAQHGLAGVINTNTAAGSLAASQSLISNALPASLAFEYTQPFTIAIAFKTGPSFGTFGVIFSLTAGTTGIWVGAGGTSAPASSGGGGKMSFGVVGQVNTHAAFIGGSTTLLVNTNYIAILSYDGSGTAGGMTITLNAVAETPAIGQNTLGTTTIVNASRQISVFDLNNGTLTTSESFGATVYGWFIFNKVTTSGDNTNIDAYLNGAYAIH